MTVWAALCKPLHGKKIRVDNGKAGSTQEPGKAHTLESVAMKLCCQGESLSIVVISSQHFNLTL